MFEPMQCFRVSSFIHERRVDCTTRCIVNYDEIVGCHGRGQDGSVRLAMMWCKEWNYEHGFARGKSEHRLIIGSLHKPATLVGVTSPLHKQSAGAGL